MHSSEQLHTYDYFIDERGDWFCEGNPVTDAQLFRMLSRSLFEGEGGYFIRCEGETHPVRVADAPLWVRYVHLDADPAGELAAVEIELRDGRREPLCAETLASAGNQGLYCLATPKRLKARFAKVAYYELTRYLKMDETSEQFYFMIGGRRYDVPAEPA